MRWRVHWHNGGCSGFEDFDSEDAAREYADHLRRTLGDAESWREGITSVSVSLYHDGVQP